MNDNPNRGEAERLLGVAEKLLQSRDYNGARDFAILSQESDPFLDGSDQILAIADVLLAADKPLTTTATSSNHRDWYSILQVPRRSDDADLIKKQYRKLAFLLHPDKNRFSHSDQAFKLVADAWAVLSDPQRKSLFDNELRPAAAHSYGAASAPSSKLPVRRSERPVPVPKRDSRGGGGGGGSGSKLTVFWTMCPYCYLIYEYPGVYRDCCLRCQNCQRAFHAALMPNLPPLVPGKDAYYCSWGFFPLGFVFGGTGNADKDNAVGSGFPSWMPPMFTPGQQPERAAAGVDNSSAGVGRAGGSGSGGVGVNVGGGGRGGGAGSGGVGHGTFPARVGVEVGGNGVANMADGNATPVGVPQKRGRGRPRKNPL